MPFELLLLEEFTLWLELQEEDLQLRIYAHLDLLELRGPALGRPYSDTLKGSQINNLKELRISYKAQAIRILFTFNQRRQAIIILGGNKKGNSRWYKEQIPLAEKLYREHLQTNSTLPNQDK